MAWWRRDKTGGGGGERRGDWSRCGGCAEILPRGEIDQHDGVCPRCQHHHPIDPQRWQTLLCDGGSFEPLGSELSPRDALGFKDTRRYKERLKTARKSSGLDEALLVGRAHLEGRPLVLALWADAFMEATLGEVAAARLSRAAEAALEARCALVSVGAPGGLRLQEGSAALWALGRVAWVRRRLAEAKLPLVTVFTAAPRGELGLALAGDVNLAEPPAAELAAAGLVDAVVPRGELRARVARLLRLLVRDTGSGGTAAATS
jgi:acetyl-CoA carboxylase carboxyl transferase subunit beta